MGYFICVSCRWVSISWKDAPFTQKEYNKNTQKMEDVVKTGMVLPHSRHICSNCGNDCKLIYGGKSPDTDDEGYVITGRDRQRTYKRIQKEEEQDDKKNKKDWW